VFHPPLVFIDLTSPEAEGLYNGNEPAVLLFVQRDTEAKISRLVDYLNL